MATPKEQAQLLKTAVVLGSPDMVARHAELGFTAAPVEADSPLDEDMARVAVRYMEREQEA